MTREEAIGIIKSECYVFNPLNLDRSTMVNTALDMAIRALDQVAKLRELRKNLAEKEQVYANESNDTTMYFIGLANAYCTVNALIDEILEVE